MYKQNSFLAIIPARGGSKGIPRKNIIHVKNKPLIQYTIESAKQSRYLDKIIVSTDDQEIANVSMRCGAEVPFLRPEELANDTAKTIDVLVHAVGELKKNGFEYDYLVLLQPTQPLRIGKHIDQAIEQIVNNEEESLVSITEVKEHPLFIRTLDNDGKVNSLLNATSTIRRQDFLKYYKVNGSIYINRLNDNFNLDTSLNDNKLGFVIDKKYDIDIDEPFDLKILELLLSGGIESE